MNAEPILKSTRQDRETRPKVGKDGDREAIASDDPRPWAHRSIHFEGSLDGEDLEAAERDEGEVLFTRHVPRKERQPGQPFRSWSVADVATWMLLTDLDCKEEVAHRIRCEEVDGLTLSAFEDHIQVKQGLGIALGKANKVWAALLELRQGTSPISQSYSPSRQDPISSAEDPRIDAKLQAELAQETEMYWKTFWGQRWNNMASTAPELTGSDPRGIDGYPDQGADDLEAQYLTYEFDVHVVREAQGPLSEIGLNINRGLTTCLRITRIKQGCIHDWNLKHPGSEVAVGDAIMSVNGKCGNAEVLVNEIRNSSAMHLVVQRRYLPDHVSRHATFT